MTQGKLPKFTILAILDGWGIAPDSPSNAITQAKTPNMKKFWISYPHTHLKASGEAVGLPRGEDGNTETGHLNLGAGRIVYQDLERVNKAIAEGIFFENSVLKGAIAHAQKNSSNLHIMGLLGAGGVHSNKEHLYALIHMAKLNNFKNVYIDIFTDGRDSPPTSAKSYVSELSEVLKKEGIGTISSLMGRYWAMDRDQRWDRTQKAYLALTKGVGKTFISADEAIEAAYKEKETDEFIKPSIIVDKAGVPLSLIKNDDAVIFFNFRIDRPRQLTKAFILTDFNSTALQTDFDPYVFGHQKSPKTDVKANPAFVRGEKLTNLHFATMTKYSSQIDKEGVKAAFPPEIIDMPLGRVFSIEGVRQLRITESEKERFVTFYFNGLREQAFPQEERIIIPSPNVPTYDQTPEMASNEVTTTLLHKLTNAEYKLVVVNFPNVDMVGHTGNIPPTISAVEAVDLAIGKIANFVLAYGGLLLITADHGNAEEMTNLKTGEIDTEHSTNPVPFIAISNSLLGKNQELSPGILADIAPTIITGMGYTVPSSMTGRNLLQGVWDM